MRRRLVVAVLPAAALAGCGFALRGPSPLLERRLALAGFAPGSTLGRALARELGYATTLEAERARAQAVVQALAEARERVATATTGAGEVRELALRLRFAYRVVDPKGATIAAPAEILVARSLTTRETDALAKAQEEQQLFAALEDDIARQVVRRLEALAAAHRP